MKRLPPWSILVLALIAATTARAGEIEILGYDTNRGLTFQGGTVSNYFTLEFAPALEGPWTNWGSVSAASITGAVMSLPTPFFYRIVATPERAFPPYATGTPVYVESDNAALDALANYEISVAAAYQPLGDYATGTPVYVESDPVAATALADYETAAHAAATYQPRGPYFTNGVSRMAIGSTNVALARRLYAGNLEYSSFSQYGIALNDLIGNETVGNAYGFVDGSDILRDGNIGYTAFSTHNGMFGATDYRALISFYGANAFASSGTIGEMATVVHYPRIESGVVSNVVGLHVYDMRTYSHTGTVYNQYGVYVNPLAKGVSNNFAFYSAGDTPSRFGAIALGTNAAVSDWPTAPAAASIVVAEDYVVQDSDCAVGADTATDDVAVSLPDRGANFSSVLIRKFSAAHALAIRRGTNIVETMTNDGDNRIYDWWPERTEWYRRN